MGYSGKHRSTLAVVEVRRSARISPHIQRITVGGDQLAALPDHGFDHWFRFFLPQEEGETSFDLPDRVDLRGYFQYLRMPGATRPHLRNYTVREFRKAALELDIDFVIHGDEGVATRWAQRTAPGDTVALLDEGRGYEFPDGTRHHLLVADETGMPAVVNILRDLPRDAVGHAFVELADPADAQPTAGPTGVEVHWLVREPGAKPGALALETVRRDWTKPAEPMAAYLVGEQALPTGLRRWLVSDLGVPKAHVVFTGYWRLGKGH